MEFSTERDWSALIVYSFIHSIYLIFPSIFYNWIKFLTTNRPISTPVSPPQDSNVCLKMKLYLEFILKKDKRKKKAISGIKSNKKIKKRGTVSHNKNKKRLQKVLYYCVTQFFYHRVYIYLTYSIIPHKQPFIYFLNRRIFLLIRHEKRNAITR